MLIGRDRFEEVYNTIRQSACAGGACTVLLLVAPDCDAVCACHVLTRLLREDNVPFKAQPVAGYGDVEGAIASLGSQFSEIRSVVLLNCGATVNLEAMFPETDATVFVIDSHRPVHLRNVHSPGRVVVLDAEALDAGDAPSDGEDLDEDFLESDVEEEDSSDSSDDEAPGDDDASEAPGAKRRREREAARAEKRARKEQDASDAAERRRRLRAYYDGTYDGPPSSALAFALSEAVHPCEPAELWLAVLGLTGARAQWRLGDDAFEDFGDFFAAQLRHVEARQPPRPEAGRGYQAPPGTVTHEAEELRFMLHRHWSLFDAMYYSNYVAARLSVWKADGRRKLQELLAKIGLSLEHCRQKYTFLTPDQRRDLAANLREQGPAYDLDRPFTQTFHRVAAAGGTVSARDVAACVEALLEGQFLEGDKPAADAGERKARFLRGFWRAYDACLGDDDQLLRRGIAAACALQRAVVEQAVSMVEKKEITTLRHFRYAYVASAATDAFARPLALRKLALFLVGVHKTNGKWVDARDKPLVILAERPEAFLVVGVDGNEGSKKNRLAHAFRLAAEHIKADVAQDLFDAAVVEVPHDDVQRFVESLHYILTATGGAK